jgi:hypothetical protein
MPKSLQAIQSSIGNIKLTRFIQARKIINLNTDKDLTENFKDLRLSLGSSKFKELERRICAEYTLIQKNGNLKRWC